MKPGEDPLDCARRELAEETGYRAAAWTALVHFFPAPGILDERMEAFVAADLREGLPQREPDELIENVPMSWDAIWDAIAKNQIQDAKTMLTLLWYDRFGRAG